MVPVYTMDTGQSILCCNNTTM